MEEDFNGNILGIQCCLVLFRKISMETNNMTISSNELVRSGLTGYLAKYTSPEFNSFTEIQVMQKFDKIQKYFASKKKLL